MNTNSEKRIIWFDVLRGFFIWLALWEHYGCMLNTWYMWYFKESNALSVGLYESHQKMIGSFNHPDSVSMWAGHTFIPWVTEIYLTMAAFNLAKRSQEEFSKTWLNKIWLFFLIFCFFVGEKFIVATSFGEAISLSPLLTWMIVLSIISVLYRFMGLTGVVFLFVISMLQWWLPFPSGSLELWMQTNVHPMMNLDAGLQHFASSGALGFMLGYLYYHYPKLLGKLQWGYLILAGLVLGVVGNYFAPPFDFPFTDLYRDEHLKTSTFPGTIEILGIQMVVIILALVAHMKGIKIPKVLSLLLWMGVNSLAIFAFHRIFFMQMWMPVVTWVTAYMHTTIPNNTWFIWSAIGVHLVFSYWLIKSRIFRIIMRD
jgi:hypothetical protein